jgi:hypothetical protein
MIYLINFFPWDIHPWWYQKYNNYDLKEYATGIQKDFPSEMIAYFEKLTDFCINEMSSQYAYKYAAKYLKFVRKIYLDVLNQQEGWENLLLTYRKKYSRKSNFLYEISNFD